MDFLLRHGLTLPDRLVYSVKSLPRSVELVPGWPLSRSTLNLGTGDFATITIIPNAVSKSVNSVRIVAFRNGVQVGDEDMTIVSVALPRIRRNNTPVGMPDRIPPRVDTPLRVEVTPDLGESGQAVTLALRGESQRNGTATINGRSMANITASGDVNFQGGTQTRPQFGVTRGFSAPNAGNLRVVVLVGGKETIRSEGFSVAAIPENYHTIFSSEIVNGGFKFRFANQIGIRVFNSWESDSGELADLGEVDQREVISEVPGSRSGSLRGIRSDSNSQYVPALRGALPDRHTIPRTGITLGNIPVIFFPRKAGRSAVRQAFVFRDRRTGVRGVLIPNSGFEIQQEVFRDGGSLRLTTIKTGQVVSVGENATQRGTGIVFHTQFIR
jgi:hypothetical protein